MSFLPYPPSNTTDAISVLKQDINLAHEIVHGDDDQDVLTENGLVPSFSKVIKTLNTGSLIVSTMNIVTTSNTAFSVSADNHITHYCCTANMDVDVIVNAPILTETGEPVTGALIFFTQVGEGVVRLVPSSGISFIYPEDASPTTFSKGATIAIESMSPTQWIVTGNMGY
jgi:hypothetical protein